MKRKRYQISYEWVVVVALLVSFAIHAFSHKEVRQEEASQKVTTSQQSDVSWEAMPESVIEMCMAAPLKKTPEVILKRKAYVASYNKNTLCPNWVAWLLTAEHTDGEMKRSSRFYEDTEVPEPRATPKDYKGSGWSRGHMCPAGDNKWNEEAMQETFALTNVCPQDAKLNSGLWNSLEMDCRKWARKYGEVYIVCGPVYYNREHEVIGENEVVVPEAFFKLVLCLKGKPKAIGVVVKNTAGEKKKDLYYNSVDQVERITGIDFFPALPDDIENEVESHANIKDWR